MKLPQNLPNALQYSKEELVDILLKEEYGFLPKAPSTISAEMVSETKTFCAGFAPLVEYSLKCETENGEFSFPVRFVCPISEKPLPCFILMNFESGAPTKYHPAENSLYLPFCSKCLSKYVYLCYITSASQSLFPYCQSACHLQLKQHSN